MTPDYEPDFNDLIADASRYKAPKEDNAYSAPTETLYERSDWIPEGELPPTFNVRVLHDYSLLPGGLIAEMPTLAAFKLIRERAAVPSLQGEVQVTITEDDFAEITAC